MNPYEKMVSVMRTESNKAPKLYDGRIGIMTSANSCKYGTIELDKDDLLIPEHLTDYETEITVDWDTEDTSGGSGYAEFATHGHDIKGKKKIIVHNALKAGDEVYLVRWSDDKYLILGKVV